MELTLVDTSVWIEFFKGTEIAEVAAFTALIEEDLVLVCPVTVQEVLQGIKTDKQFEKIKLLLSALPKIAVDSYQIGVKAASLYRQLRKEGITPRSSNDVLIAAFAIYANVAILAIDRDFERIAAASELTLYRSV